MKPVVPTSIEVSLLHRTLVADSLRTDAQRALTCAVLLFGIILVFAGLAVGDTTSSTSTNFIGTSISAGDTIWFTSVLKPSGLEGSSVTVFIRKSTINFSANGNNYSVPAPDSDVTFSPTTTTATVSFDATNNIWRITVPSSGLAGNTLLNAVQFPVPAGGLPGGIQNVTWQASFSTDTAGISLQWKWGAAVYSSFSADYNNLGVKPVDDNKASQYQNSDHAGTPENYKSYVIGGATGGGGSNWTGGLSGTASLSIPVAQAATANPGGPYNAYVAQVLSFNGNGSTDPNGYTLNYSWNFGDGTTATGASPSHAYYSAGTFTVTLKVDDGRNITGTSSTSANITLPPPPTISAMISPAPNANGWNNTSVTVTFSCSDPNVGIKTCPAPITVTTTGANQVVQGTAIDNAGVSATISPTVSIDETVPLITASASPAADTDGWNNSNVTVSFQCSDALSGIAACPSSILVSASGASQSISGTAADKAGNSASAGIVLNIEETPPSITASVAPPPNSAGWNNTNLTVSFTCTASTSPITSCASPQTVTTEGAGQVVSGSVSDQANNSNTAKITVNVAKTLPAITYSISPAANSNGWNKSAVTVTFNCAQTTAPLATCSQPQTISTEGVNQAVTGTVTDVAGNTASATAQVNIATTPPTITASISPQPNSSGWNNSAVTVTFTCAATTAPIANCPQPQTISTEGANQNVSGTVIDVAGNSATATVQVSIALTPPQIVALPSPAPDASGWNDTAVTVSFTCTNTTAPIAICPPAQTISAQGAGQQVSGTVTDVAGNSAAATLTINIGTTPPTIAGAISPAPNAAVWNNSAVTVSFTCAPGTAPISTCTSPVSLATEGVSQPVTGTATDAAGNSAAVTVNVNIDETPPSVSILSPANGSTLSSSQLSLTGNVTDALSGVAAVMCNGSAATVQSGAFSCSLVLSSGANTISIQATDVAGNTSTQSETVTLANGPSIAGFNPASASIGSTVVLSGSSFLAAGSLQVSLAQQGGGSIIAPILNASDTSISFVVPAGATTGPIMVTTAGGSATSAASLAIVSSSNFNLAVGPSAVTLFPGQSTTVEVSLASSNGFTQAAMLNIAGVPSGITASFQPPQITAGQSSVLTLAAPASQNLGSAQLSISASATVQGISLNSSAPVTLNVQAAGNVAFAGRVAVTGDPYDTPIVGLTVKFTGVNYTGNTTDCTASTRTDASGNFLFSGLPEECAGPQIVQYDPSTVTAPPGKYSGVNLSYVLSPGQVTTPGIVVHLPRVDNAETVQVAQNSSTDQIFTFKSVPNLMIVVYAGTNFSLADGSKPDPFPLSVVEIPYDHLPEQMFPDPTQVPVYAMSIEPFNSSSSQPVAVFYPNRSNTAPGINMPLTSLSPTLGIMVNYGTGTVSADGTQIMPDRDPSYPGHAFGISHFDWFFFLPPPPNNTNPSPDPNGPRAGDPVDPASGVLVVNKTDIAFGNARGQVALIRTYRTLSDNLGPFGLGTSHNYNYLLDVSSFIGGAATISLVMPDGNRFSFAQQTDGTFTNSTIPSLSGAILTNPLSGTYNLRWKNGTAYQFQQPSNASSSAYLTSITDANGNTTTFVRNNLSEIMQIIDPVGRALNFTYGLDSQGHIGLITAATDPIGRTIQYSYDTSPGKGTLTSVTDAAGGVTSYAYDDQNRLVSITDPRRITYLQNTYDANGRIATQTAADNGITTFSYILLNAAAPTSPVDQTVVTDPLGNQTIYHFNPQGFVLDVTDALGGKTVYNRASGTNLLTSVTDRLERTTAYTYDSAGNTISITRLAGTSGAATTTFAYDPKFNRVTSVTDPLQHTTTFSYDPVTGNLSATTDSLQNQSTFTYDQYGELQSSTDPLKNTTRFEYLNGDLVSTKDPLQRLTTRVTDGVGRLVSASNPLGQTTRYQYNGANQITAIIDSAGNETDFSFDGNGNLSRVVDANKHTTSFAYDFIDRVASRADPLSNTESYLYDKNGNVTQFTDRRNKVSVYTYDALNRRTGEKYGGGESSVSYVYDQGDHLIQATDSITGTITRSYDGLDRMLSENTPQGTVTYSYDLAGRRTGMQASGQAATSYTYDSDNRLTQISQGSSAVSLAYDMDGRRTLVTLPNGIVMTYGYDGASQLDGINYQIGNTLLGNLTYTYDLAGHRSAIGGSFARTGLPQAVSSGTYNAANQMTQFGASTLTYDLNGNVTSDGVNSYMWDARNRLASINGRISAAFQYDPFGRRVTKSIAGTTTNYLYDSWNPIEELSAGVPSASILSGLEIDERFQRISATESDTYLPDAINSTVAVANSGGSIFVNYTYEPFGNTSQSSSTTNSYQFTGQEIDATGLYFYRARYYAPQIGRFISEDPLRTGAGTSFYAYASNDPILFTDPSGMVNYGQLGLGLGNIGFGVGKIAGLVALAPETGGASLVLAVYAGAGSFGQILAGTGQIYGALSGDQEAAEEIEQSGTIMGNPLSGVPALVISGNMETAAQVASAESMIEGGVGLVKKLDTLGTAAAATASEVLSDAWDFLTGAAGARGRGHTGQCSLAARKC